MTTDLIIRAAGKYLANAKKGNLSLSLFAQGVGNSGRARHPEPPDTSVAGPPLALGISLRRCLLHPFAGFSWPTLEIWLSQLTAKPRAAFVLMGAIYHHLNDLMSTIGISNALKCVFI